MRGGAKFGGGSVTSNRDSSLTTRRSIHSAIHEPGREVRRNLFEQLHPLAPPRAYNRGKTGRVAAGPRQARDVAAADRIGNQHEDDGDGTCLFQHRPSGGRTLRKNEV